MEKVTKTILCDMCGAEIDTSDDNVLRNSVIAGGYYGVTVVEHNPSYPEGRRTSVQHQSIDLCPACADRATNIHCEVVPTDGGRSCHHELSWRDSTCEMLDMLEREDADGTYWDSPAWQCTSCGEMVSGIHTSMATMVPPRYCPNCGARVERVVSE